VICPPFGWEEMCSYRPRRAWAQALAKAGYPAVRIDLPGAGDSAGSPSDPGRVDAWTRAVATAAAWLRRETGCQRVVAIGLGLGGMVACRAIAQDAPIDDLVLWGVPAAGRRLVRELRAYAGVVAARYPAEVENPPPLPEGALEVTGFLLSAETAGALSELDLTRLPFPDAAHRRILMVERDGLGVDKGLRDHFQGQGADVEVVASNEYSALMSHPQEAKVPYATIDRTFAWLASAPGGARVADEPIAVTAELERAEVEFAYAGSTIREAPLAFEVGPGRLFGVLSQPVDTDALPFCAVLLNSGAIRRIGPNRTWVEQARAWAARGVPTVRVDLAGIGDSDGDDRPYVDVGRLYTPEMTEQVLAVLEQLRKRGLPDRFILVGLCSGAYWALHAALADERIVGAMMVNLFAFQWSDDLVAERDRREAVAALNTYALKRLATGRITREQIRRVIRSMRRVSVLRGGLGSAVAGQAADIDRALDKLRDQGTQLLLLLSMGEPLYEEFVRDGRVDRLERWSNLRIERIPSSDHMSRALWLQRHVAERLTAALERVLDAERAPAG
jgi:pimeloyl-ACP methyl ester carboxylesterase